MAGLLVFVLNLFYFRMRGRKKLSDDEKLKRREVYVRDETWTLLQNYASALPREGKYEKPSKKLMGNFEIASKTQ